MKKQKIHDQLLQIIKIQEALFRIEIKKSVKNKNNFYFFCTSSLRVLPKKSKSPFLNVSFWKESWIFQKTE